MIENTDTQHVIVYHGSLVNIYDCTIGRGTTVGPFVEIQRGAVIGAQSKICSHSFICSGVTIGARVFVGHGVMFCNDLYPVIGMPLVMRRTVVEDDVSIGSGATILPVSIGRGAIIGAGSVVSKDVPPFTIVVGNPARAVIGFKSLEERNGYIADNNCLPF